jgi:hypothetical protein
MKLQEKIDELFQIASGSTGIGTVDFKSICKIVWMCLNNSVTLVDLAGVFTVSIPDNGVEVLNADLFVDFIKALARVKYPLDGDYCDKLVDEVRSSKNMRINNESPQFPLIMDRSVIRILLKYDLPIRRAYSTFCGQSVRVGGRLNWDEVKKMSIGMEVP